MSGLLDVDFLFTAYAFALFAVALCAGSLVGVAVLVLGQALVAALLFGLLFGSGRLVEGAEVDFAYNVDSGHILDGAEGEYFGFLGCFLLRLGGCSGLGWSLFGLRLGLGRGCRLLGGRFGLLFDGLGLGGGSWGRLGLGFGCLGCSLGSLDGLLDGLGGNRCGGSLGLGGRSGLLGSRFGLGLNGLGLDGVAFRVEVYVSDDAGTCYSGGGGGLSRGCCLGGGFGSVGCGRGLRFGLRLGF